MKYVTNMFLRTIITFFRSYYYYLFVFFFFNPNIIVLGVNVKVVLVIINKTFYNVGIIKNYYFLQCRISACIN